MAAPRRSPRLSTRSPASKPPSKATSTADFHPPAQGPHYLFVGGKGGAGKTTCAAGIAVSAAARGQRTLVISTDPAPSLGDAFGRSFGAAPRRIPLRRGSLHGVEIDAPAALERWLAGRRHALERIALRGTWLDQEDVSRLLQLSLPGIDELAALFEIARFASTGKYDLIVVDTAPTGHTLRMLATPGTLRGIARVFDQMQAKHRVMVDALRGGWQPDVEDRLIEEIDRDGRELADLLRNPRLVRLSWVTLPEPMSVEETADAAGSLASQGIPLGDIIVNCVMPAPDRPCGWCGGRRALERQAIDAIRERVPGTPLIAVTAQVSEPKGLLALRRIGAEIVAGAPVSRPAAGRARGWRAPVRPAAAASVTPLLATGDTRLLLFGGKGGVGKTTCAAAAALALAEETPARRVLLLSTDPAHSLGDVFGRPVSDTAGTIDGGPANLAVREIDAAQGFRHVRERYASAIDALFDRLSRGSSASVGFDAGHDRQVMHGLIDLAPPGIDELAAVIGVTDALDQARDRGPDLVVMDTAPSGHALRLLEMPALVQDWARALMSILLKYQPVVGVGELGSVLLHLSQGLGRLRALLQDPRRTSFVTVTRAAVLPREETSRLLARLRRMKVHVPAVVVNAVGRGTCGRCRKVSVAEARELATLRGEVARGRAQRLHVLVAPAMMPPPHGPGALHQWEKTWRSLPVPPRQ